jgi:CheY-like chemotaxis protein
MDKGRVAIFEDNSAMLELYKTLVEFCQHEVVLDATSLQEALERIDERILKLGEIALDGVLLDGNLELGATSNSDGKIIADRLRQAPGGEDICIVNTTGTDTDIVGQSVRHKKQDSFQAVREIDNFIKKK